MTDSANIALRTQYYIRVQHASHPISTQERAYEANQPPLLLPPQPSHLPTSPSARPFPSPCFDRPHASTRTSPQKTHLLRNADDATRGPRPRVPRLLALLGAASAQVVGAGVHDDGALFTFEKGPSRLACGRDDGGGADGGRGELRMGKSWGGRRLKLTPKTLSGPISLIRGSVCEPLAQPWPSVLKLPRSPTWRSESEGAPWVLEKGLTGFFVAAQACTQHSTCTNLGLVMGNGLGRRKTGVEEGVI